MTDLHARLVAAVTARLKLAHAAADSLDDWTLDKTASGPAVGPWSRDVNYSMWHCDDEQDGCPEIARGWIAEGRHIVANDPAFVIRACEADIERLGRHAADSRGCCPICSLETNDGYDRISVDWPCTEVLSIAHVYGVEVEQ